MFKLITGRVAFRGYIFRVTCCCWTNSHCSCAVRNILGARGGVAIKALEQPILTSNSKYLFGKVVVLQFFAKSVRVVHCATILFPCKYNQSETLAFKSRSYETVPVFRFQWQSEIDNFLYFSPCWISFFLPGTMNKKERQVTPDAIV